MAALTIQRRATTTRAVLSMDASMRRIRKPGGCLRQRLRATSLGSHLHTGASRTITDQNLSYGIRLIASLIWRSPVRDGCD